MGLDLFQCSPAARAVFERAEAARPGLQGLCFRGTAAALNATVNTQPCLFAVDLACAQALIEAGVSPHGVAGFSLGEIPAVCVAGLLDEDQGFDFVCRRAEAMQACGDRHPGVMFAVVRLSSDEVEALSRQLGAVYPVNYNCPGQTVVACPAETGPALQAAVTNAGGKAIRLAVSGAFHSPLMDEAADALARLVADIDFGEMTIPAYANLTGQPYDDPRALLSQQVNHPVRWQATIERMIADGFDTFVEVGPGRTLSGFIQKIDGDVRVLNVCDAASLDQIVAALEVAHV